MLRAFRRRIRWFTRGREKTRHPMYSQVDERNLLACRVSCKGFSCFFYSCRYGRRSIGWNDGRNEPGPVFLLNEIFINCNVTRLKTSQKIIRICNNANIFSAEIICPFPTKSVDKVMGRRYSATCWQCPKGRCEILLGDRRQTHCLPMNRHGTVTGVTNSAS